MARTQAQVLNEIRFRLESDDANGRWTDEELRIYINEAAREVALLTRCLRDEDTVTITAGTQTYTQGAAGFNTDIVEVTQCEYIMTGSTYQWPLEYIDYQSGAQYWGRSVSVTQGKPQYWTTWGFPPSLKLYLYPKPAVSGTLKVFYYRLPSDLTTTSNASAGTAVEIPTGWERLLVDYVAYRAFMGDGQRDKALDAFNQFNTGMSHLSGVAARFTDQPGRFNHTVRQLEGWG